MLINLNTYLYLKLSLSSYGINSYDTDYVLFQVKFYVLILKTSYNLKFIPIITCIVTSLWLKLNFVLLHTVYLLLDDNPHGNCFYKYLRWHILLNCNFLTKPKKAQLFLLHRKMFWVIKRKCSMVQCKVYALHWSVERARF